MEHILSPMLTCRDWTRESLLLKKVTMTNQWCSSDHCSKVIKLVLSRQFIVALPPPPRLLDLLCNNENWQIILPFPVQIYYFNEHITSRQLLEQVSESNDFIMNACTGANTAQGPPSHWTKAVGSSALKWKPKKNNKINLYQNILSKYVCK